MQGSQTKVLRGMTWKHDRGLAPLLATARHFCEEYPEVTIKWETRSLQEFGESSVRVLADQYDMVVIDHPFMGQVARERSFLPLDEHFKPAQLQELEQDSVGGVVGGTGDLQQLARPLDFALLRFLRLDERAGAHRVSFAKKAVARFRMSTSSRSRRFSRRSSASSCRSGRRTR